jgi:hypothetical protein
VKRHLAELDIKSTFVLNYDMIGYMNSPIEVIETCGIPKPKRVCDYLNRMAAEIAKSHQYDFRGFYLPTGAATDAYIFRNHGIMAMDFINKSCAFKTHSPRDTPDKFNPETAKKVAILTVDLVQQINNTISKT